MTEAVLRLWLKVADPAALTARETLQRGLGFGRKVRGVERSQVWGFRWHETDDPESVIQRLAGETNLFVNPNKHRFEIAVGAAAIRPRGNAWVLVSAPGDGAKMEETLRRHHLVSNEIPKVRRGVLWELDLDVAEGERRALAGEIAVTKSRRQGLLANPEVEDALVFADPPGAGELVRGFVF